MPFKGYKQTREHIEKVRRAMGIASIETRKKMSIGHLGKHYHSDEFKRKVAERNKTKKNRRKVSIALTGKKFSKERREKISGRNSGQWKGGITPINKQIRSSMEYKLWRTAVFERDDYTCVWCGVKSGMGKSVELQADHIKPFCSHPELRFAIDNGRTLCRPCHLKTDTWGVKSRKYV